VASLLAEEAEDRTVVTKRTERCAVEYVGKQVRFKCKGRPGGFLVGTASEAKTGQRFPIPVARHVVLRQDHRAGEKLFVDYAGDTIVIHDPLGGPAREASLFVAVLGASSYTFAEATGSQELEN
jgi:hypothetical protein